MAKQETKPENINENVDSTYRVRQDFQGHGIWQFEDFLTANGKQYGVHEVSRKPQKEVKTSFDGQEIETVEFDLMLQSDGSSIKCNFKTTPAPGGKKGGRKESEFSMDLSNIHTEAQAKQAFKQFHSLMWDFHLKHHPANTPLKVYQGGSRRWKSIDEQIAIDAIQDRAEAFRERGIEVYVDGKLIVGPRPEDDLKEGSRESKRPKSFDIPRPPRVPKLTKDD